MPNYFYRARKASGEAVEGIISEASPDLAAGELQRRGLIPIDLSAEAEKRARVPAFGRISHEDLIVFSRQLATLIKAGIPFLRALTTLEEQTRSSRLKSVISAIIADVESGTTFSEALEHHPGVFMPLYVSMVRVGEEAGVLDDMLDRLSGLLEHEAITRERVKSAVRYPMLVVFVLGAAFFFLTGFVVPRFAKLYASAKVELPLPTRILIGLNHVLLEYWPFLIAGAVGIFFFVKAYLRTPAGRWNMDMLKLKFPLIGPIIEKSVLSRFARIFGTLYKSGIPMLHTLDIVAGTIGNVIIGKAVNIIKEDVREGKGLASPISRTGVFPPMVIQMVSVGEETGSLDDMMFKVSDYYDLEVEYGLRNLSNTIEPVLIVLLAGVILFVALGIFLPIWDMISVMKG